ncbi:hypothetical protein IPL68_02080 [Candidatus Saccharibacteria bacterium]|nr:MAG: hypothetical protein IPL68_02080 [Candidatus Saccharibacteria bacterium]
MEKNFRAAKMISGRADDNAGFLRATVVYKTACATVEITGSILHYVDILGFVQDCRDMHQTNTGKIVFSTLEPFIHYELKADYSVI